ncbi:MAG: mandelate racemase/muconate lactonizing enzyme family protein [Chloroflexota bacterium]
MRITAVTATTCVVPLPRPIVMGEIRFDAREYIVVQVSADTGHTGIGFGMTRNSPVAAVVERSLAPYLVGRDPLLTEGHWDALYYRNLPQGQRGIFMRALSAVDIALWDLKGQIAGLPVWKLLGGARDRVPVSVAGGYPASDRTLADFEAEMADYAEKGYRTIKIAAGELADDTIRLRAARRVLGPDIALANDVHWAFRDLLSVVPTVRTWEELGLAFLEDPFPSELVELSVQLREQTGQRLALGEDTVGRWAFRDLLDRHRPDLLRVDATVAGGLSEAARICALAGAAGVPVFPHVFPEVHVHLGAAFPGIAMVEMTDPAYQTETLYQLFRAWVRYEDGVLIAPDRPGLGVELDPDAIERFAVR